MLKNTFPTTTNQLWEKKIHDAVESAKEHIPHHHEPTLGEKVHEVIDNIKDRISGHHEETIGEKVHDAIDSVKEHIPHHHHEEPTLGERINDAIESAKEHIPHHHHEEAPAEPESQGLGDRIRNLLHKLGNAVGLGGNASESEQVHEKLSNNPEDQDGEL